MYRERAREAFVKPSVALSPRGRRCDELRRNGVLKLRRCPLVFPVRSAAHFLLAFRGGSCVQTAAQQRRFVAASFASVATSILSQSHKQNREPRDSALLVPRYDKARATANTSSFDYRFNAQHREFFGGRDGSSAAHDRFVPCNCASYLSPA